MPPIKKDVVAKIEMIAPTDARVAASVAREQIVMEGAVTSAPGATESVVVQIEGLAGDAPLDREAFDREFFVFADQRFVYVPIEREVFVEAPACRAMIDNDAADWVPAKRVITPFELAATEAHVAHDDVVRIDFGGFTANANAIARRSLACHCDERMVYGKPVRQRNDSGNSKHNDAWLGSGESFAKTTGAAVGQSSDFVNLSAPAARSDCACAFCAGKCGHFWWRAPADGGSRANAERGMQNAECEDKIAKSEIRNSKQIRSPKFEDESQSLLFHRRC